MSSNFKIFDKCYAFKEAEQARAAGIYPFFKPIGKNAGTKVIIEGRELLMAGSNNYLGLAGDPRMVEASVKTLKEYGTSCSGSRFMNGTLSLHEDLEEKLADFVGKEEALCFTTGHQTNLGAISTLVGRGDHVITDKYNHASIMDGIFLTVGLNKSVNVHRYRHNNYEELERILKSIPEDAPKLIVTDGVFSMEGDIVDLPQMRLLADKYNAAIYLDEAHSIGVLGETGRGTTEHFNNSAFADVMMCTFSKSFGSIGGFVAGDSKIIDYIKHFARPLMFSASMPPANIVAASTALEIIKKEPERVQRLQQIGRKMAKGFSDMGFDTGSTTTPIVPLVIGDNEKAFIFWKTLFEKGVYVNPVITPAVPPNRAMIRTSFMSTHTDTELNQILEIIGDTGKALGLI
ncbi:MAG: pyridoxal phosphate-dependent aminotransferase family protein [Spirochaetales bacterium]|nr:pyridoxal phosphate-dependent aminotransferase family protein [Spirochaetales bacterium]